MAIRALRVCPPRKPESDSSWVLPRVKGHLSTPDAARTHHLRKRARRASTNEPTSSLDDLLRPRIAGQPVPSASFHVHDADAYSATPGELASAHAPVPGPRPTWYFLTRPHYHGGDRRCRKVGCSAGGKGNEGFWKPQRFTKHEEADDGGGVLYIRNYVYQIARKPEWVMMEYGIVREGYRREELVLCEMYRAKARNNRPR